MKKAAVGILVGLVCGALTGRGDQVITNSLTVTSNLTVNLSSTFKGGITAQTNLTVRGANAEWVVFSTNRAVFWVPLRLGGTNTLPQSPSGTAIGATLQRDPSLANANWSSALAFEYYSLQAGRMVTNFLYAFEGSGYAAPGLYRDATGTWFRIWDAGTDGAGSGLDADLLDGQHGGAFVASSGGAATNLRVSGTFTVGGGGLIVTGDCVRLGSGSVATPYCDAVGVWSTATYFSVAMGPLSTARTNSVAMGLYAYGEGSSSALGYDATASESSVAVGPGTRARGWSVAVGLGALATNGGVAIGAYALGENFGAALGAGAAGDTEGAAVGDGAQGNAYGAAVGAQAIGFAHGVAVGNCAEGSDQGSALGCFAWGTGSGVAAGLWADGRQEGTAVGVFSDARTNGVAVGYFARAVGPGRFAVGGAEEGGINPAVADAAGAGQLGPGSNSVPNSLQFREWPLVLDGGAIPTARLTNALATHGIRLAGGTPELTGAIVSGATRFEAGIAYVAALGDVSMGSYTNQSVP